MSSKALEPEELKQQLADLPGWQFENNKIGKRYQWNSYLAGINFVNIVAALAEKLQHHPDIHIGYKEVSLSFTTHDAGHRVTLRDFKAARAIEALPIFVK